MSTTAAGRWAGSNAVVTDLGRLPKCGTAITARFCESCAVARAMYGGEPVERAMSQALQVFGNRRWLWPIATFALAYAAVAITYAVVESIWRIPHSYVANFICWDGAWILGAAAEGYPQVLPSANGHLTESTAAFFPLYPLLMRAAAVLTFGNWKVAPLVTQIVTGIAMALAVWRYVAEDLGEQAADRAVVLTALLPGSVVMAMGYTEPLAIALSAWCFLELRCRRWVLAGVAGALGSITRPDMLALTAACLWSAVAAFSKDGDRKAFLAPILAPLGMAGWLGILAARYHSLGWWFLLQRQAWGMRFDFGHLNMVRLLWLTPEPEHYPVFWVLADVTLLLFAAGLLLAWRKLRPEVRVYVISVAALSLGSSLPTIRYLFKAWPVSVAGVGMSRRTYLAVATVLAVAFIAQAVWWPMQRAGAPAP
jgi:hypothetical protein